MSPRKPREPRVYRSARALEFAIIGRAVAGGVIAGVVGGWLGRALAEVLRGIW